MNKLKRMRLTAAEMVHLLAIVLGASTPAPALVPARNASRSD